MKIQYFGHSCVQLSFQDKQILIDPFISGNEQAKDIQIENIQPDYILITHAHQDHILDVETIAKQSNASVIANFEIATYFSKKGIDTFALNHGGSFTGNGFKAKNVNAIHTSSFPDGSYGGQPSGYIIHNEDFAIYNAGDTALTYDMKLIGEEFTIDLAILPIGDCFTMGVKDAIKAAKFVGTKQVIGVHYNTFPPIEINTEEAVKAFREENIDLILLPIGKEHHL